MTVIKSGKWFRVHSEISVLLKKLYKSNQTDAGIILYSICYGDTEFRVKNKWIEKFKSKFKVASLDPIHIFSSFNGNNLSAENRVDRINNLLRILGSKRYYSAINFDGCPTPFIIHMIGARNEKMQREVWQAFQAILENRHRGLTKEIFDSALKWYGIDIASFTIFLFWIDSLNFLPVDKNTVEFLLSTARISKNPRSFDEYRSLLTWTNSSVYREISQMSYEFIVLGNRRKLLPRVESYIKRQTPEAKRKNQKIKQQTPEVKRIDFKVVAIQPQKGIDKKYSKVLTVGKLYKFFDYYGFEPGNVITYDPESKVDIYNISDLNIEISAIVGKNGSGKSTITELLYLAINNLAAKKLYNKGHKLHFEKKLFLDLYYITSELFQIRFMGDKIHIYKFRYKNNTYSNPVKVALKNFQMESFFYSVAINYSHFSLNSRHIGEWIQKILDKNDGYQTPLVINPYKKEGKIDINIEETLVKSRLLSNILEPILQQENTGIKNSLRYLTKTKFTDKLVLKLNREKIDSGLDFDFHTMSLEEVLIYGDQILRELQKAFKLRLTSLTGMPVPMASIVDCAKIYIIKKVISIAVKYLPFNKYFDLKTLKFKNLDKYISELYADNSHITFKLKQAIHFLKFDHLSKKTESFSIDVDNLSDKILTLKRDNADLNLSTVHLIPPSFFDVRIMMKEGNTPHDFQDLSSGEKQRIYTVSTLVYHLFNLNSVSRNNEYLNYRYVNIIFDEIELYFHPDMQRTFIDYILWYLEKVNLNNISALNFSFVTHSPFILSDIPKHNILFLGDTQTTGLKTFGANIHELLMDGFFMEHTIGEYALRQINEILKFAGRLESAKTDEINSLNSEYQINKKKYYYVVTNIGEDYLRKIMENHLKAVEQKLDEPTYIEWYRDKLETELAKLNQQHAKDQLSA